jgi:hypothetical protein
MLMMLVLSVGSCWPEEDETRYTHKRGIAVFSLSTSASSALRYSVYPPLGSMSFEWL